MTHQQALKILMLSPVFHILSPQERVRLVKEYCHRFAEVSASKAQRDGKKHH